MSSTDKIARILRQKSLQGNLLATYQRYQNQETNSEVAQMLLDECIKIHLESDFAVNSLNLKKFRALHDANVRFDPHLTLFIGQNGTGKTAILDAIAKALSYVVASYSTKTGVGAQLQNCDISADIENATYASIGLELKVGKDNFKFGITKSIDPHDSSSSSDLQDFKSYGKLLRLISNTKLVNLPTMVYYRIDRSSSLKLNYKVNSLTSVTHKRGDVLTAFTNNGFISPLKADSFEHWIAGLFKTKLANETNTPNEFKNKGSVDSVLLSVDRQIKLLVDILKQKHIAGIRDITFDLSEGIDQIMVLEYKKFHNYSHLSDGQRLYLALVCDLVRRMTVLNPLLENPLEGRGIVLIDEVELHLHPKWQQDIVPTLMDLFPNIQFILTSHSPQVLSSVDKKHLRLIERDDSTGEVVISHVDTQTEGVGTSDILNNLMGVISPPPDSVGVKFIRNFDEHISDPKCDLAEIEKQLDAVGKHFGRDSIIFLKCSFEFEQLKKIRENYETVR